MDVPVAVKDVLAAVRVAARDLANQVAGEVVKQHARLIAKVEAISGEYVFIRKNGIIITTSS